MLRIMDLPNGTEVPCELLSKGILVLVDHLLQPKLPTAQTHIYRAMLCQRVLQRAKSSALNLFIDLLMQIVIQNQGLLPLAYALYCDIYKTSPSPYSAHAPANLAELAHYLNKKSTIGFQGARCACSYTMPAIA